MRAKTSLLIRFLSVMICFFPALSSARWETVDEASVTFIDDHDEYDVAADGSYVNLRHRVVKIEKESAIKDYGTAELEYDGAIETMEIVSAFVKNDETRIAVDKKYIEHRSAGADNTGFNSKKVIVIAFPGIRTGSITELTIKKTRFKAIHQGHFSQIYTPGTFHSKKGRLMTVRSAIPLQYSISGPKGYIAGASKKNGNIYEYYFDLKKDIYLQIAPNSEPGLWFPETFYPVINLTSFKSWADMTGVFSKKLHPIINSKLPARFVSFVEKAKSETGFERRADVLVSQMIQELRYMGDWRNSNFYHMPRSFEEIDRTSFGDCKDLSLVLAAMLRTLGYKADLAVIERTEWPSYLQMPLPLTQFFNHMIVRAEDENGKLYWLDPTNRTANAKGKWPDLADRPVIAMAPWATTPERTPALLPEDTQSHAIRTDEMSETGQVKTSLTMVYSGTIESEMLPELRLRGDKKSSQFFISMLTGSNPYKDEQVDVKVADPYIAAPLTIKASAVVTRVPSRTTAGFSYTLPAIFSTHANFSSEERELGVKIGDIETTGMKVHLTGIKLIGELPEKCEIDSRWIKGSVTYSQTDKGILIETSEVIKKNKFTNAELKSAEFKTLIQKIKNCHSLRQLIYKPLGKS